MKKYIEMTVAEVQEVIKRGGDDLNKLNQQVAEHLVSLELSNDASAIIADTPINNMAEAFGGLFTVKEVEQFIREDY